MRWGIRGTGGEHEVGDKGTGGEHEVGDKGNRKGT